jgi:hypothetical protein
MAPSTSSYQHARLPNNLVSDGPEWADSEAAAGRTAQRFSALRSGFYASLLADLGVSAVACLGSGSPSTARALHARGIAAMDLALEAAPSASGGDELAAIVVALDRPLALAGAAAVAWLHMLAPWMLQ